MSIQTITRLTKKVESLTPTILNSINRNKRVSKQFVRQEQDNNQDLFDLLYISKILKNKQKQNESDGISPELIDTIRSLQEDSNNKNEIISKLVQINKKLQEENEQAGEILKSIDPSTLKTALKTAGIGAAVLGTGVAAIEYVAPGSITPIITGRYGEQRGSRNHGGSDLAVPEGTPLRAISDGEIVDSDFQSGWGNFLVFKDDKGIYHLYGHMQNGYKRGGAVKKGDIIGKVGMTGRTTGPHLHWETGTGWDKSYITGAFDPLNRYSKHAPFSTARESAKPKKQSTSSNDLKTSSKESKPNLSMVSQPSSGGTPNQQTPNPPTPPSSKSSNPLVALQFHNTQ